MRRRNSIGLTFVEFGELAEVEVNHEYLILRNTDGLRRYKSKVYASWPNSKKYAEALIGKKIITCATTKSSFSPDVWFSDLFEDRIFTLWPQNKEHRLLAAPKGSSEDVLNLLVAARISIQQTERNFERRKAFEISDYEEQIQYYKEERELLTSEELDSLNVDAENVKNACKRWIAEDKFREFRVYGFANSGGRKLGHVDKHFAMRYGLDITNKKRLQVAVQRYLDNNYILGDIMLGDTPIPCKMAVAKRHEDNSWIVKTCRPLKNTARFYQIESKILGDRKDIDEPLSFWLGIYDKIMKKLEA